MAKKKKSKKSKSRKWKVLWKLMKLGFILFCFLFVYLLYCYITLPDMEQALYRNRQPATAVLANNGNEIQSFGTIYSEVIYMKDLPPFVPSSIVAIEDRRFYSHFGFDVIGFGRAMFKNIMSGKYSEGGSTITQQVAKNLFLTPKKSITRKTQELMLAFWLEYKFSKEQILTLYLNRVYLGAGVYGVEAASQKYFQKSSRDLNEMEAAVIAGMLKAPSRYNPMFNKKRAMDRAKTVLRVMKDNDYISDQAYLRAVKLSIGSGFDFNAGGGKYFADYVYGEANSFMGERVDDVYILTTLNQDMQRVAEEVLRDELAANKDKNATQGAVVIMSLDGAILAMVGGVNYNESQFNRAVQALRQPGSAFKPFVYLTAFEQGFEVFDKIDDYPISVGKWNPENYDKKYYGEVTLMQALTKSLNLATINLADKVGRDKVIKIARKMGISTKISNTPAMALGSFEVKILDMAAAYTTVANGGIAVFPYGIEEVYTKQGMQLYMRESSEKKHILDEDAIRKLTEVLKNVIDNGTGRAAKLESFAAGKTGTSQDYKDAWFAGFNNKYVCVVWVGNDDNSPMKEVTGGNLPARIWKKVMSNIE